MSRSRSADEIRNLLQGLIFDCPIGEAQGACIVGRVRALPPSERLRWVNELSNDECLGLFLDHKDCLLRCETALGLRDTE